jgi:hypothetical protein
MFLVMNRLGKMGYRRPGLVMHRAHDERIMHRWEAAFRIYHEYYKDFINIPPLMLEELDEGEFKKWFQRMEPDVVSMSPQPRSQVDEGTWRRSSGNTRILLSQREDESHSRGRARPPSLSHWRTGHGTPEFLDLHQQVRHSRNAFQHHDSVCLGRWPYTAANGIAFHFLWHSPLLRNVGVDSSAIREMGKHEGHVAELSWPMRMDVSEAVRHSGWTGILQQDAEGSRVCVGK